MRCILCKSEKIKLVGEIKSSYSWIQLEIPKFDIYDCEVCDTRFCYPNETPPSFYEQIFKDTNLYSQHLVVANSIKLEEDPAFTLITRGQGYYALFEFLKGKRNLKILDVGCSYGSLVFALHWMGHEVGGIDVTKTAIDKAIEIYGIPRFLCMDIKEFSEKATEKLDLITALDVIEHVPNPLEFVRNCLLTLKENGTLFITTPNRGFFKKENVPHLKSWKLERGDIWFTDQPPVHLSLFTKKSLEYIAKQFNLKIEFVGLPGMADINGEGSTLAVALTKQKLK